MPVKYVKMYKNGSWEFIQEDRINRFLEEGWTMNNDGSTQEKKSPAKSSKNKITADAQVTSSDKVEEEEIEDVLEEEDNWTFSDQDFETAKKED